MLLERLGRFFARALRGDAGERLVSTADCAGGSVPVVTLCPRQQEGRLAWQQLRHHRGSQEVSANTDRWTDIMPLAKPAITTCVWLVA